MLPSLYLASEVAQTYKECSEKSYEGEENGQGVTGHRIDFNWAPRRNI